MSITGSPNTTIFCQGSQSGSISLTASSGFDNYLWSTNQNSQTLNLISPPAFTTTYSVLGTLSSNGCASVANYTISINEMQTTVTSTTNNTCYNGTAGSITTTTTGNIGTVTYSISPGSSTNTTGVFNGLNAGTYTITATDGGCSTSATATLTQPTLLSVSIAPPTNVSCFGGSNGGATATASGGTAGYSYSWNRNGSTTILSTASNLVNVNAGTYICTVTDANACTATSSVSITEPAQLTISINSQIDVSCFGGSNGSASSLPSGGILNYTYLWSPTGGTNANSTSTLSSGTYIVQVTDANSCTATASVLIAGPSSALSITSISTTPADCLNGYANGTATVSPSGGWGGYSYLWSNSNTGVTSTSLNAGSSYSCTVTDSHGCTTSGTSSPITSILGFSLSTSSTPASCIGISADGTATVTPAPAGTYNYNWDALADGQTIATAINLEPETYTVVVSSGSCSASATVTISNSVTYNFTNPSITTSTTWSGAGTYKVKGVVLIGSGATLTIDGKDVEFTYDKKQSLHGGAVRYYKAGIVVSPGGKLIVKGGSILSGCSGGVWDGIQMNGDQNSGQTSAQPIVEIYDATIKNAYAGVCANSYDYFYPSSKDALAPASGGILHTYNGATFLNNRRSILFPTVNYSTVMTSTIDQTNFIYNDDSPFKDEFSVRFPMVFISTSYNRGIIISNCTFTSSVSISDYNLRGTGIKGFNSAFSVVNINPNIDGNVFVNLTDAIESNCSNSLSTNLYISENTFDGNLHSVSGNGFSFSSIGGNKFNIPHRSGYISWGCYLTESNGFNISNNQFNGPSNDSDPNFGVIIRGSNLAPTISDNNTFSDLFVGTQTELKNDQLQIYCNNYTGNQIAWRINPGLSFSYLFNTQGDGDDPTLNVRANNLFDSYSTCSGGTVAIENYTSASWDYYAWGFPPETFPDGSCSNIGSHLITCSGTSTDPNSRCLWRLCNPGNADCIGDLKNSLNSISNLKQRDGIIKEVIKFYLDNNSPDSLTSFLLTLSDPKSSKLLLEKYIKYNEYTNARTKLDLIESDTLIESDFKSFNNVILDLLNDQLTIDSLTESQKVLIDSLKNIKSETSEKAKAVIEKVDYDYEPRVPDFPGLERRRKPEIKSSEIKLSMRNYPNPFSTNTIIEINSYLDFNSSNLVIINVLGERIKSYEINAENTKFEISNTALVPGIYYYFIINRDGKIVLTKSMVVTN